MNAAEQVSAHHVSHKAGQFTESVIREMTRLALEHGAMNLAQGFPDFAAPAEVKEAARRAITADINQYAITWGAREFRRAIAERFAKDTGIEVDPEREITVTCGATEAMIASLLAVVDPGEEVVVFEPFYENYGPDAIICGAVPRFVSLRPPDWTFDPDELRAAVTGRTRALILNTPNNPTGKVFSREELDVIAEVALSANAYVVTDEIYQYMTYDGTRHVSMATLPGMRDRTITLNALSKTYSVTGWRVGYAIAPAEVSSAVRKMHDFLTVGAAAPLQEAGVTALRLPEDYYRQLAADYEGRRNRMLGALTAAGFRCYKPHGAYYVMTDISEFGFPDDVQFARYLVSEIGVAVVPGSSFYRDPSTGRQQVRFCFSKTDATLDEAGRRLAKLRAP
ncbi:MAG TPA: aminotransferase class I/II-fold pyridoxal phosphate-dependent enzyme [Terriglobia bacterium]|jgi:aminotransferase|nr:aminotransferase class I/II-fold pyridoxal phosphate-dependent enzyme [Terriglobia bacterium]